MNNLITIIYNLLGDDIASKENILAIVDSEDIDISNFDINTIVSEVNRLKHNN